jgi:radical SAM superfamily enzyme YgiQ (UPF0313 family)
MFKKKLLFVFLNPVLSPLVQPYGLSILASVLNKEGIEATIIHPFLHDQPIYFFSSTLKELKPSIVGFSLRNLDVASFSNLEDNDYTFLDTLKTFVDETRRIDPTTLIVLGGSGYSIAPQYILNEVKADIGFVGPCEHDFATFCKRYLQRADGRIIDSDTAKIKTAILPADKKCPTMDDYRPKLAKTNPVFLAESIEIAKLVGGTIPVRTKTGCSLHCAYCVVPYIEPLCERPGTDVIKELEQVTSMGLGDRIFIADGEFNLPSSRRAIDLCRKICAKFKDDLKWRCYICPSDVNKDLVQWMKKAGCVWVSLTVDSFDAIALRGMGKGHTEEQAIEATKLFLDYGIELNLNILFGGPGESLASLSKTLDCCAWAIELGAHLSPIFGLRVYPDTPLHNLAIKPDEKEFVQWGNKYPYLGHYCRPLDKNELANIFSKRFNNSEAIHHAKTEILNNDPNVEIAKAFNLHLQGDSDKAEVLLKRMHARQPDCKRTALALVKVLYSKGNVSEAIKIMEMFVK